MKKRFIIFNASIITLLVCGLIFFINFAKVRNYSTDFANNKSNFGPFETVNGIPYVFSNNRITVNDGLAHLRVPYSAYKIGKELTLNTNYQLDGASVLEAGLRKSSFWLDYERKPIRNKILDDMVFNTKKKWKTLEKNGQTIFLSPYFGNDFSSFDDFINNPPKEGAIGLYGSVQFNCPENTCHTTPFQYWTDLKAYQAIYADYIPVKDTTFQTSTLHFALDNSYQNTDGSFDVMYFSFSQGDVTPVVMYRDISGAISPMPPSFPEISTSFKDALKSIIFRPLTQS
jgi:hypothetical protein